MNQKSEKNVLMSHTNKRDIAGSRLLASFLWTLQTVTGTCQGVQSLHLLT